MKKMVVLAVILTLLAGTLPVHAEEMDFTDLDMNLAEMETVEAEILSYGTDYANLHWHAVSGHTYEIYRHSIGRDRKVSSLMADTDQEVTYAVTDLSPGRTYVFKVVDTGTKKFDKIKGAAAPAKVKDAEYDDSSGMITFGKVKHADGYVIQYSENPDFTECKKQSARKTSVRMEGLKKGEEYWCRARAYVNGGWKKYYGSWSEPVHFIHHEKTMEDGVTYLDGIIIVNKTYSLPASYGPSLQQETLDAFHEMQQAAAGEGLNLTIVSGFRSYSEQSSLYSGYYDASGYYADTFSARPGYSEHQTGYALDLNNASDSFGLTAEGRWLSDNCQKYGFIIRYPQSKQDVTGYKYEPWHVRYVGNELSEKLYNNGDWITLEEYFGITSSYQ